MYKVEPNLKEMLKLTEQSLEELKGRYKVLMEELNFARNAFEFDRASEIKTEMVYIIEELKKRSRM
ncbi:hypothetical protein QA612_04750 [Evansella sp. AB-P1]|uniref:hypothetical protein n=1 Tax=Evansella sp. AB-P1 TaxID=3037653 RepID=UPI00242001C1|nr:hypothetical protein [Evansella sp. AB-P1]MDG5786791.1 hypothetical protein [Evansella sp. AB-P1]